MTVARRANLVFTLVFVLALAAAGTVFVLARQSSSLLARYHDRTAALQATVAALRSDFYNYDDQMNMYVAVLAGSADQAQLAETTYQQAVEARQSMGQDLDHADSLTTDPKLRALLQRLRNDYVGYNGFADQTRARAQAGDVRRAIYLTTVGNLQPSNDMMPTLDAARSALDVLIKTEFDRLQSRLRLTQIVCVIFGALVLSMLLGLRLGLQSLVLRPVAALRDSMSGIATGRIARSDRVVAVRHDEFGAVADAFNTMLDALAEQDAVLAREQAVREADIQAGAERTRAAEQSVRDRAQAAVEESSTAVLTELGKVVADVEAVLSTANVIDERVRDATERTHDVVAQAGEADTVVGALGESLRRVGGMADLIAGVADQTKLLALNATIEAARAGESGKGFSVVASEVKDLAQTITQSTSEISNTVGTLQQNATAMTSAISAMADGITAVDEATAVLAGVAAEQRTVVQRLQQSVDEAATRIRSMADMDQRLERRRHPRTAASADVSLTIEGRTYPAGLVDLSEGGLRCRLDGGHARPGSAVVAELTLGGDRLSLRSTVLEETGDGDVRIKFAEPAGGDLARLRKHLPFH